MPPSEGASFPCPFPARGEVRDSYPQHTGEYPMQVHRLVARADNMWQWYKPRYRTERSDARTYSVPEVIQYAEERGLVVSLGLLQRRWKYV